MSCHPTCNQGRHCDGSCLDEDDTRFHRYGLLTMASWFWLVYFSALGGVAWMVWP